MLPFAGYADFADCVSKNQDKGDPEAYCAVIKRQVEGEALGKGSPSDVERAKTHFNISDEIWDALSSREKMSYLSRLPPVGSKREARRHYDFKRIHDEFVNYYGVSLGDREYYEWLRDMDLDETLEYGQARESFRWARDMLKFLREDADNKYYKVIVGLPIKSLNRNVYRERDLVAAALSLKGKHPSLNHKPEYWFSPENPRNVWGELTVVDGKYEDGACEAVLQVPKSAWCPICDGAKMTDLIDNKRVVNVSLEGDCIGGFCDVTGECRGFEFNDPPFTLLTSDVLPGIPLARIKPLEAYLPFSWSSKQRGNTTKKIKMRVKEKTMKKHKIRLKVKESGTSAGSANIAAVKSETPKRQAPLVGPKTVMGTPAAEDGYNILQSGPNYGHEKPGQFLKDTPAGSNVPPTEQVSPSDAAAKVITVTLPEPIMQDTPMPNPAQTDKVVGPSQTQPLPQSPATVSGTPTMPQSDTSMKPTSPDTLTPKPSHDCPEDQHWDDTAGACMPNVPLTEQEQQCKDGEHWDETQGRCVSDALTHEHDVVSSFERLPSLEERRARIHAELHAKTSEERAVAWEQKHNKVYEQLKVLEGQLSGLSRAFDKINVQLRNSEVERDRAVQKYNTQCGLVTDLKSTLDETKHQLDDATRKYNDALGTNLELSRKLTAANEDYLELAKDKETLREKLVRSRTQAKKILKIKV